VAKSSCSFEPAAETELDFRSLLPEQFEGVVPGVVRIPYDSQSRHIGSSRRAPSMPRISIVFHPNAVRISVTIFFAASSSFTQTRFGFYFLPVPVRSC